MPVAAHIEKAPMRQVARRLRQRHLCFT